MLEDLFLEELMDEEERFARQTDHHQTSIIRHLWTWSTSPVATRGITEPRIDSVRGLEDVAEALHVFNGQTTRVQNLMIFRRWRSPVLHVVRHLVVQSADRLFIACEYFERGEIDEWLPLPSNKMECRWKKLLAELHSEYWLSSS